MSSDKEPSGWKRWLWLSPQESLVVGGILVIALVGLLARHIYLRGQSTVKVEPPVATEVQSFQ